MFPLFSFAQLTDNFSDGDFSNNPAWSGDVADFVVEDVSGNYRLRSNSTVASSNFYLSTTSNVVNDCQWEFYVNLAFNTSGTNYVDVYLTSDSANLKAANNSGYFVRIGNTPDEISLYKKSAGTSTKIIDGTDGITNSSNNILKIKVTRDSTNLWTLMRDITGTGNSFVPEGTVTDAVILSSGYFGIFIQQSTASFFQKHYFDDFYVGTIIGDTSAPQVNAVNVIANTALDVLFNETVEKISAENISNYVVNNGIGNPVSAVRDATDSSIVHLTFSTTFQNGITNTISISNISDLNANILAATSRDFLFFIPATPVYGDVLINEIFPDPDPQVALPAAEFVEIFNNSAKVFDVSGWKFSDASSTATLVSSVLLPGQYLILCSNSNVSLFSPFGNTLGIGTLPSLNNTSDVLSLTDDAGLLLDKVAYSDTWYQDAVKRAGGWTLERIDPNFPCENSANWSASNDALGGTPGKINSINGTLTDTTAPAITAIELLFSDTLKLTFSEPVDSASAATLSNYAVNNGIGNPTGVVVLPGFTQVKISFSTGFSTSVIYQLTVNGLFDCIGNTTQNATIDFAVPVPADLHDVIITEIFPDPDPQVALPAFEFVEIYNRSSNAISLTDWTISDASSSATLPAYLLLPGEYLILCAAANDAAFSSYGKTLGLSSLPSLNNDSDELTLKTRYGVAVHYLRYSDTWYRDAIKKSGGWSLEMIDTDYPCSGAGNWRASNDARGGTPGIVNSVKGVNPDEVAPSINYVLVQDSQRVLIAFDESLHRSAAFAINFTISGGISVGVATFTSPAYDEILLGTSPLQQNILYTLTVNNVTDCAGNVMGVNNVVQFGFPELPDSFDLVINEILSNPVTGGSDFIELYNRSQKVIDLKDVLLASIDEDTGDTNAVAISTKGYQLLPGKYVALTASPENITQQYYTPNPKGVLLVSGMPTYDDDEDIVALFNRLNNNSAIDAVHYFKDWHFALLDDLNGVSLERMNYDAASQDKNNWHSAASTVGYATPAYQNSQFGENLASTSTITLEPKTFSPDNDGYQDVLNIQYALDQPGYVANITVYDDDGRKTREVVSNWLLDAEGSITWDGINDNGEKARIGIYIVIVELFDLSGNKERFKEVCVVAGKL